MAQDRRDPASASLSVSVVRSLLASVVLAAGTPVGLAAGPSAMQQSTARGVIIGTVSERGSLQPIAQALVVVSGTDQSVTTNASGQFRIANLAPGTHELQVTALSYQSVSNEPVAVFSILRRASPLPWRVSPWLWRDSSSPPPRPSGARTKFPP